MGGATDFRKLGRSHKHSGADASEKETAGDAEPWKGYAKKNHDETSSDEKADEEAIGPWARGSRFYHVSMGPAGTGIDSRA